MISLGTIAKLAKGGLGPKELAVLLEGLGFKLKFKELPAEEFQAGFQRAASAATLPCSRVIVISGYDRDGQVMEVLMVLAPPQLLLEEKAEFPTCQKM